MTTRVARITQRAVEVVDFQLYCVSEVVFEPPVPHCPDVPGYRDLYMKCFYNILEADSYREALRNDPGGADAC